MADMPHVTPSYAPQPAEVAWPTDGWPRATIDQHGTLERVVDELFSHDDLAFTNAVMVIQGGRVLVERYAGVQEFFDRPAEPYSPTSRFVSQSLAKSVFHMIVGTLVDQERLDPAQLAPVPEWASPSDPRHQIRIAEMLAMRDGLDFVENYEIGQDSHVIEMLVGQGALDMAAYAASRPLAHEPGSRFNYSSGTTNVLSRIVADQVGRGDAYAQYLRERLFDPIGMTSANPLFDPSGNWIASSWLHATAQDYARFGLLYLRGGEWDGRQLVSRAWTDTAQVPISQDEESGDYYSWQWWVTGDRYGTYWASGFEGQMISVVPALDALVLRFGRTPEENYPALQAWRSRVLDVLASSYAPS
jgi:CubicO group peptidase (beta-lactamase class C family)